MARWQLTEPHYLAVEGCKWEYIETDRSTGKQVRKQFDVPQYYHHENEGDWTEFTTLSNGARASGMVVVSDGHNAKPSDIIFKGAPTPAMLALDDEAKAISAKYRDKWNLPDQMFDISQPGDYAAKLADHFVQQQDKMNMQVASLAEQNTRGFQDFIKTMGEVMKQNQVVLQALSNKVK